VLLHQGAYMSTFAQDSSILNSPASINLSKKYVETVGERSEKLTSDLDKQTEKYLQNLQRQEASMQQKLSKIDSVASKNIFNGAQQKYQQLQGEIINKSQNLLKGTGQYIPWLDTATTSLKFLANNNPLVSKITGGQAQMQAALSKVHALEDQFKQAENIKEFIRQRKEYLQQQLANYDFGSDLKNYNQQAYYYAQQINEYKAALDDPEKLEEKALTLLNKLPAFQDFLKKNSMLAGLFNVPDNYSSPGAVAGLQTRDAVQELLNKKMAMMGPSGSQTAQQNILDAQSQLTQLRNKFTQTGTGGEMPDFKPNNQKTKTFLKRIEYGINAQTTQSSYFFPTTTNFGLSVGYKINDKNSFGVGMSYAMGWGSDIHHIKITSEGIGIRSYVDLKIKKSWYASGGFEYNYQEPFNSYSQIQNLSSWSQSGLIGISKEIPVKTKLFKSAKIQLLWDFLSYYQIPRTQPIKFRFGYSF
jgi:hypothetical protein